MLFTRKGDQGNSGIFGSDKRLPKDSPLFEALGTLDELNALLGFCFLRGNVLAPVGEYTAPDIVRRVQEDLFIVQAELAGAQKSLSQRHVTQLERIIAAIEEAIENPHAFVISGTTELSTLFDYARTVSRRAERSVIAAKAIKKVSPETYKYLNRLSSLLYVLARYAAQGTEPTPSY